MGPPNIKLYAAGLLLLNLLACASKPAMPEMQHHMIMSARAEAFTQTMRRLWAEEVILRRRYVSDGTQELRTRLLAKQEEISNAIAPYYGADAAQKLTDLLERRALMAPDDPHARENSAAIAALLKIPTIAAMLDDLFPMKELSPAFNQGMAIADAFAHGIVMQFPDRF